MGIGKKSFSGMAGKKAFEIQFNWIFVLIAGAAILLFFGAVVSKQKSLSETSTRATALKNLEAIISGASVSTDTSKQDDIPNFNIDIECNKVSIGAISKQYESLALFAPASVAGSKLITQTLAFSAPYKATNLVYMSSPQVRYILIGSTSLAGEINRSLSSHLNKEYHRTNPQIRNENDGKVRLIVFGSMIPFPSSLQKMQDSDVSAISVVEPQPVIIFYQKEGNSWGEKGRSIYIGKQSLIGAVYADTRELYECSMINGIARLNPVTKVYIDRTKNIMSGIGEGQSECRNFYQTALNSLQKIYDSTVDIDNSNFQSIGATISSEARKLSDENRKLQQYSCPLVY